MVSGRPGLAGAHALKNVTLRAVVLEVNIEIAQVPLQLLEARDATLDIPRRTSIASTTVLVSSGNVKCLILVKTLRI